MKNKSKSSTNRWQQFSLRMKLLWIWFLKNITLFIKVSIIIVAILVGTNIIGDEFFLVEILHLDELSNINWNSVKGIENAIAIVVSAIITALMFFKKTKHLAIEDIKSRDLKIALIKAHLYFNENGKLCKRIEELADIELTDDDKIGKNNIGNIDNENIITGLGRAASELKTVLTADLTQDDEKIIEPEELHDEIIEETDNIGLDDSEGVNINTKEQLKNNKEAKPKKPNIFITSWNKIVQSSKSFWNNLSVAFKSLKDPKLNDGMDVKKQKKTAKKDIKEKEDIEILNIEQEVKDNNTSIVESENVEQVNESETIITEPVKETTKEVSNTPIKTSKQKQIEDILNSMK